MKKEPKTPQEIRNSPNNISRTKFGAKNEEKESLNNKRKNIRKSQDLMELIFRTLKVKRMIKK